MVTHATLHVGSTRRIADETWPVLFRLAFTNSLEAEIRVPPGCDTRAKTDRLRLVRDMLSDAIRDLEAPCQPA